MFANCSGINGTGYLVIYPQLLDLIVKLDKTSGSIPDSVDFVLNGSDSYDPNYVATLTYLWACNYDDGSDCTNIIKQNGLKNITIQAKNLVGGKTMNLTLTITDNAFNRQASVSISITVVSGLHTYISIDFTQAYIEPSARNYIKSIITTTVPNITYTINWKQTSGDSVALSSINLPSLYIPPNTLTRGGQYAFQVTVTETSGSFAYSYVNFIANLAPICLDSFTITPSTGSALATVFQFSIASCSDPENNIPLSYKFSTVSSKKKSCNLSTGKQYSSASSKLYAEVFVASVTVCDTLSGCSTYSINLTVTSRKRMLSDTSNLDSYISDTFDPEAIPMMSLAYLETFSFESAEIDYIQNDVVSYIYNSSTIDQDSVSLILNLVNTFFSSNQINSLTYNRIAAYAQQVLKVMNMSSVSLTADSVNLAFTFVENILNYGNYQMTYILLADSFFNSVLEMYTVGALPGTTLANLASNGTFMFKYNAISNNLAGTSYNFSDGTSVTIQSLPFYSTSILNLIVSIYPQANNYSSIVDITFTNNGNYINQTIVSSNEQIVSLTTSTVTILIPFTKSASNWACAYYDSGTWVQGGCTIEAVYSSSVLVRISHTSMFTLVEGNVASTSSSGNSAYGPVYLTGIFICLLLIGYPVLLILDKSNRKLLTPVNESNAKLSENTHVIINTSDYEPIPLISYHLLIGICYQNKRIKKTHIFLTLMTIFNLQLVIEGALIGYYSIDESYQSRMALIGFIAVLCSVPLNILETFVRPTMQKIQIFLLGILNLIIFLTSSALTIEIAITLAYGRHNEWVISFFWGVFFEILMETLVLFIKYSTTKMFDNKTKENINICSDSNLKPSLQYRSDKVEIIKEKIESKISENDEDPNTPGRSLEDKPKID